MRQTVKGLVAAFAVMTASAAPAMACGGWSCGSPCGGYYAGGCGGGYGYGSYGYGGGYGYSAYAGYGYGGGYGYQTVPAPQYYYVSQGPTYSGPGNFAPYPTYQEAAVLGYGNYYRGVSYPYDGGRYANAYTHGYDGAPPVGPQIIRRGGLSTGYYGARRVYAPRVGYASRQWGPSPRWNRPVVRRYY